MDRTFLDAILQGCTECHSCVERCAFLQGKGTPLQIAKEFDQGGYGSAEPAFQCSLCSLCTAVCPEGLAPKNLFLETRRRAVAEKKSLKRYKPLLAYEQRGKSRRYTFDAIPEGATRVFFPGCALPGTRPKRTWQLFRELQKIDPAMAMVLDCCGKPSHDLGRQEHFVSSFESLHRRLYTQGIREIILACPNCHNIFSQYGTLKVLSLYEFLRRGNLKVSSELSALKGNIHLHTACALRFYPEVQKSVADLFEETSLDIKEKKPEEILCCGEGGSVHFTHPHLAREWTRKSIESAGGKTIVTSCAGCTSFLGREADALHITDLIFEPERSLARKVKGSKPPLTYLNRLFLKRKLKRNFSQGNREGSPQRI